jgi:DNA mismatch repair protein MutH
MLPSGDLQRGPPASAEELVAWAQGLVGATVAAIAGALGLEAGGDAVRTKGSGGAILERALGATGGSSRVHDFPELGIELKTIPIDSRGVPLESTYVCTLSLADAEYQEWADSWVRAKLARVLFVPLVGERGRPWGDRRVGAPLLWSPSAEQDDILRADFEEVVGLVGVGRIEDLTARLGRWMQVRPKAAHGGVRTIAFGSEGEAIETVPRGFYLRTRFTGALLLDPKALPP